MVRRNPPLFKSAYGMHATITSGEAAKVLEVYTARPAVSWRRACMYAHPPQGSFCSCQFQMSHERTCNRDSWQDNGLLGGTYGVPS
jgi:hypothetical protein